MFWDVIFKRKIKNSELVNPNIFVDIVDYSELDDNSKAIVNRYKEEYQELFKSIYSTKDLDKDIIEEILLYQDLILNVLCKDTYGELLESRLSSVKLNLYSKKYNEISEILKLKYIALLELKKDKKYLSLHNRLYLKAKYKINVIDIINYHESTLYNLIATINDRIIKCISVCSLSNPRIDLYKEELEKRYNEVNYYYKTIFNKEITILESIVDSVAYAEIELEKYAINNKDKLTQYQNRLIEISNMEIKDLNERDNIIEELMNINKNYRIYKKYGRNIISQKELEELYQIIFNVYTYFPYDNDFKGYFMTIQISKITDEVKYYEKIVEYKYELLKKGKSVVFLSNSNYDYDVINTLVNIFDWYRIKFPKNNNYSFSLSESIIIEHLELLLSLDYENGLEDYLERKIFKVNFLSYKEKLKYISQFMQNIQYKENGSNTIPDPCFRKEKYGLIDVDKDLEELNIFLSLYKDSINYNVLPIINDNHFYEEDWKEYICYLNNEFIYIPDNYINIKLNYYDYSNDISKVYVLPNSVEQLVLSYLDISWTNKRIVLPSQLADNFNILWLLMDAKSNINRGNLETLFDTLFRTFIFNEEVFQLNCNDLAKYFNRIFSFLKDILSCIDENKYFIGYDLNNILRIIVNRISYFTKDGEIINMFNENTVDNILQNMYYFRTLMNKDNNYYYNLFIEFLIELVSEYLNNYYDNKKIILKK